MRDVVYAVRSDETTHRFVNHSLANLDTKTDVNPFALREPNMFVKGAKIEYVWHPAPPILTPVYMCSDSTAPSQRSTWPSRDSCCKTIEARQLRVSQPISGT
jgi:hypothetical protein